MTLEQAISHLEEELKNKQDWSCVACKEEHEQLLSWLKELQAIKSAEPSEAIDCFKRVWNDINAHNNYRQDFEDLEIVKNYILKAQEQEKVLNIIKEKNVRIYWIKSYSCVESYNKGLPPKEQLTQEEFNTLKEYFK